MRFSYSMIIGISIVIVAFVTANFLMNFYHYGEYLRIDEGHIWHCSSDDKVQFCDNASIRILELFGPEHCPVLEMRKSLGLVDPTAMCL